MTTHPEHRGLVFRTLDIDDESGLLDGWYQATRRGFHQARGGSAGRQAWLEHVRADRLTLRGAWAEADGYGLDTIPVATFSSWDMSINVGDGRTLPLRMISDVTVSPTHRRQGLLRTLMTIDLADAVAERLPLAALTVSEGAIYGRFGFGAATNVCPIEVDVTSRFRLREEPADDGRLVLTEPADAWKAVEACFAEFHLRTRGSVARPLFYQQWLSSAWDFDGDSANESRQRVVLHLDATGHADGYVVFTVADKRNDAGLRVASVVDLVAGSPTVYLRLWHFLASLDRVDRVAWHMAPVDNPLWWALTEPYAITKTEVDDFLWVRVLDVAAALEARPWGADGVVVLDIDDPLGHAAGRWRVAVAGGRAEVARTDADADIALASDTLGALYLGGVGVPTLAAAGRLAGSPESLATWAAMCATGPAPYCITGF